ncbi:DUF2970 domain-containing protein [Colwelliaceae bacterium BS250]|jgi:hypothetical protein
MTKSDQVEDVKSVQEEVKPPSIKDVAGSVGAAFLGVQSDKNRERDFSQGKFSHFIIVGAIAVLLFVASLIGIVSLVLPD